MYDFNGDEELKKQFFQEIENSSVQKISGKITRIDGEIIYLGEKNLLDDVSINYQCTSDENIFNFGEMYVGSAEIMVNLSEEDVNLVQGGELQLNFSLQDIFNECIPMGVWDIVSVERDTNGIVKIKGYDHLNRLNVPITDNTIGAIYMKSALKQVSRDAKVEFAQTIEELQEIFGEAIQSFASSFYSSCWDEVKAIAQFLGCFVFANREGKIEFRNFSSTPVLDIPAEKRFSTKISDYQYSVKGISYTDDFGQTVTYAGSNGSCILGFSENKYIWSTEKNPETAYYNDLKRIAYNVGCYQNPAIDTKWSPGEIEYYGNPALDVGDMVQIVGSTYNNSNFLITSISWQFRAPQILISAGAPETSTTVSSGSSVGATVAVGFGVGVLVFVGTGVGVCASLVPAKASSAVATAYPQSCSSVSRIRDICVAPCPYPSVLMTATTFTFLPILFFILVMFLTIASKSISTQTLS